MESRAYDSAVAAQDLTKRYPNGITAINGLSLAVRRGETFGLLGANGAGKTTLIKIITTLLRATSGSLKVLGRDARHDSSAIRRRMGVVSQEINLDTSLTVRQNLAFHCRYFGIGHKEAVRRIDEWMDALSLVSRADERVRTLSGGTKRKVMVARAFITDPELLVLDEPTNGLDPVVRQVVWDRIGSFRRSGKTVLLSTHHFEEADRLCDRIGIIHGGMLIPRDDGMDVETAFRKVIDESDCIVCP